VQLAPGLLARETPLDCALLLSGQAQHISELEIVLYKPRWGAFYQTNLEERLRRWAVDTVVVSGCNYPNCPRASMVEASERDFRVVLVTDAVSGLDDRGQREMTDIGVALWSTKGVEDVLLSQSVPS
jgi:nicotinamidase-related amidase